MTNLVPTPSLDTWYEDELVTVDWLNRNVRDVQKFLAYAPMTIVTRVATQSIPNVTATPITWDTEVIDVDGMFSAPSTNLTVQRPGVYTVQYQPHTTSNATDVRSGQIMVNGTMVASNGNTVASGVDTCLNCAAVVALNTGDVITGTVWQDSGSALNSGGLVNWGAPRMAVRLISTADLDINYSNPTPPPSTPPSGTPTKHTSTFYATWSRTYDGSGATTWDDSPSCYQGQYNPQPVRGNTRSLVGFDYNAIKTALSGATNISGTVTFKCLHAFYNTGLPVVFMKYHNYTSKPSTWNPANVFSMGNYTNGVPYGGTGVCNLSAACVSGFQKGTVTGIGFGPVSPTLNQYYGYMAGATNSSKPYLTFTYWK